jgi:hypothetical protein
MPIRYPAIGTTSGQMGADNQRSLFIQLTDEARSGLQEGVWVSEWKSWILGFFKTGCLVNSRASGVIGNNSKANGRRMQGAELN